MKPGHRTGRRPGALRADKGEMMDLCALLHTYGLGCRSIAKLTGYSDEIIAYYMRCAGLPRQTPATMVAAIMRNLPLEVAAQCQRIHTRSMVAHQKALNRIAESQARSVHRLVDEDGELSSNFGDAIRPEKAEAA